MGAGGEGISVNGTHDGSLEGSLRRLWEWEEKLGKGTGLGTHTVPGTSLPSLPHLLKTLLENKSSVNLSDWKSADAVRSAVRSFMTVDVNDADKRAKLVEGVNGHHRQHHSRSDASRSAHARSVRSISSDETLNDLFDVVLPVTSAGDATLDFLASWRGRLTKQFSEL